MRKVYLTIIFYILCTNLFAQMQKEAEVDSILWSPTEKLRWADFQGPPNPQALFEKAACASNIYVEGLMHKEKLPDFIVGCYFLKYSTRGKVAIENKKVEIWSDQATKPTFEDENNHQ
ncbi:hypothetical protein QNI19_07995 [Cytophagaceae bacterium DM2B3-1]|uniref:Uncharacterized protein n=1 Tax=Xanthocytophaga flava TaxID=3048013 RepID=A0ABT7CGJ4_9BACT|nr:hypothetical protein [Xanthocytophaga flavus]MDJ1492868.1 hypothetical protein [Xanthocytophaga flavus]